MPPKMSVRVVDAWKHGVKPSTLAHCFQHSQVKVHGPSPMHIDNDLNEVEEEIYDCIRVAHTGFDRANLPEFINPDEEIVTNSIAEEEQRILDTYEPAPLQESDSDSDDIPSISYKVALEALETLRLFRLQHPLLSLQKREQLEGLLYRESTRHGSKDAASDKYHGVFYAALGHFLVFFVYILI
ncbi:hypothetical protein BGX38DRAFT_392308 [Terfezia claveryi]|nr:hypothetical protein BGX38DRAFT_392308 [Terfezia claveryi]